MTYTINVVYHTWATLHPNPVIWISAVIHLGKGQITWETDVNLILDSFWVIVLCLFKNIKLIRF